ncbi:MAG: DUF1343 domain-containing protein [Lentisphaeria bacterium]|nr:DUF1343 domain-containing protein [Lentisphaeria bacterium]
MGIKKVTAILVIFVGFGSYLLGAEKFVSSVEVFLDKYTYIVKNKRVGLIVNNTAIDSKGRKTIDLLHQDKRVNLVALFAPEHGVRGDVPAGVEVKNSIDRKTKLPVYSTYYNNTKQPNPADLKKVDILIFQMQDIGCKTYTYIWTMAEAMKAAAKAKIPLIILDVPQFAGIKNPDGFIREDRYKSFIGLYPTPYMYGLTVGEMARFIRKEYKINCNLYVIPMHNYRRNIPYHRLKIPFVQLSPNVPEITAAYGYYITGPIGELGIVNIGLKQGMSFQIIAAPYINGNKMANHLNKMNLKGVKFIPYSYVATFGRFKGEKISGVKLQFTDVENLQPIRCITAILCYLRDHEKSFKWNTSDPKFNATFDKAIGTDKIRIAIQRGDSYWTIIKSYQNDLNKYNQKIQKYKIYR